MNHIETLKLQLDDLLKINWCKCSLSKMAWISKQVDALRSAIEAMEKLHAAEAACAEMRAALTTLRESAAGLGHQGTVEWINRILDKATPGQGWHSPEEWDQMVQHFRDHLNSDEAAINTAGERIKQFEQQLAEARKDSERMEWLEKNKMSIYVWGEYVACGGIWGKTAREAIDTARDKEGANQ